MGTLTRIARGAAGVLAVVAYQVGAHYAAATPGAHGFGLALAIVPLLAIALVAAVRSAHRARLLPLWALVCAALWLARALLARHFEWGLYLEHVSFNLMMAFVFGRTLAAGREPLCTQFAAILHDPLTPEVARYTRQITVAWTLFFVGMAAISTLLFAMAPIVTWSTFANYLALPLVGAMFVAESACRRIVLPPAQRAGLLASVRAYRQSMHARAGRAR
ncbi:membrane protein [Ralstonia solanacearum]|uniref:COG4648 family protein n=1 Tax=Ralstonia solanacearum TaxID=305 RepID=UPI0005060250|nr:membrane protein [Ralstonia solanacearum]KFX26368.1 membrane protein [Ralstonia solanacearum]